MAREQICDVVKEQIVNVLPHLSKDRIAAPMRLKDLGADSVARADIYALTMESLGLDLPLVAFASVADVGGLVDLLCGALEIARGR